jgi:hypothetical protein
VRFVVPAQRQIHSESRHGRPPIGASNEHRGRTLLASHTTR